jgi:hypothetical protein
MNLELEMARSRIEDRTVNYVGVTVYCEADCDVNKDEYSIHLTSFIGSLDLNSPGGIDDISLIKEAVDEHVLNEQYHGDLVVSLVLKESGEWQDVFWTKWYVIDRVNVQQM